MAKMRAWFVTALSVASLALLLATATEPAWIERLLGVAPDGGDGSAEVIVTLALVVVTIASGFGAVVAWRRALSR